MNKTAIQNWNELEDRKPAYALVADVDLVIVRFDDEISVLYGRCAHLPILPRHWHLSEFNIDDLTTFKKDMAELTGVAYGGVR
jgi:nitrite reductase/ring-hydroxylating ferredoxin subunit